MIDLSCVRLFQLLFDQFTLYLVDSTCEKPKQHAFDPFLQCLIYLTCIWSIHPVLGWSNLYLIEIAWIGTLGSVLHVHDLIYMYLPDAGSLPLLLMIMKLVQVCVIALSCVRLFQPLYIQFILHLVNSTCDSGDVNDQYNMHLIHSYCVWSIWPVYDLFTLC